MGKKLDAIRNKSKEGSDSFKDTKSLSQKAVSDVKQMKGLIDSLPTDVDDEILTAAETVKEGTKSDAEGYMNSEVKQNLESGKKQMDASTKAANDQIKNNEAVKKTFEKMDSVGSFGKNARGEGTRQVDSLTNQFNSEIGKNEAAIQEANSSFQKDLSDISSTF